jgi:hypothetical protein
MVTVCIGLEAHIASNGNSLTDLHCAQSISLPCSAVFCFQQSLLGNGSQQCLFLFSLTAGECFTTPCGLRRVQSHIQRYVSTEGKSPSILQCQAPKTRILLLTDNCGFVVVMLDKLKKKNTDLEHAIE